MYRLSQKTWCAVVTICLCLCSTLSSQAFYMAAPYRMVGGKMMVEAQIGSKVGHFIVDTGAPCALTASFAQQMGISGGETLQFVDSNGAPVNVSVTMLRSLKLGGVNFMQLQAVVLESGNIVEQMGADGIIGYNLMQQGNVKFDSRRRLFIVTDERDSLAVDYNHCSELLPDSYAPMFLVRIGTQTDTVMFDSGAESFYEMCTATYERWVSKDDVFEVLGHGRGVLSAGAAGVEDFSEKHRLLIPSLVVGSTTFRRATTITTDAFESRIGMQLLEYGDVVLDFEDGFFFFLPHNAAASPDIYEPEWNIVPVVNNGHLIAGMVWNALPGGIQSGDRIVAINGERIGEVDMHEALTRNLFNLNPNGTQITYLDGRTGMEKTEFLFMQ